MTEPTKKTIIREYHKGKPCPYSNNFVLCQEGYCDRCYLFEQPIIKNIPCPDDCVFNAMPERKCIYHIQDDVPSTPIDRCPYYKKANKRKCYDCGWEGLENETGFGHNDFYCPTCCQESLEQLL